MCRSLIAGEQVAGLELWRLLKSSQRAECWLGMEADGRPAVLKCLHPPYAGKQEFLQLAEWLRQEKSGTLLRVFRSGIMTSGMPFAVMEYAAGGTLRERLRRQPQLPLPECVRLCRSLLLGLTALHRGGIVHRDVKPGNILLMPDGTCRLADFGIAKLPGAGEERGKVFGTASYISPEQALESCRADCRSDLYSAALVIFEALTGAPLRPRGQFVGILKQVILDRFPVPERQLRAVATDAFAELLLQMLEYNPKRRPDSPEQALAMLDRLELIPA